MGESGIVQDPNIPYYNITQMRGYSFDCSYLFEPTLKSISTSNELAIVRTEHRQVMKAEDSSFRKWHPFGDRRACNNPDLGKDPPSAIAYSPNGKYIIIGYSTGKLLVLNAINGLELKLHDSGTNSEVTKIVFSQDSISFFAFFENKQLYQFTIQVKIASFGLRQINLLDYLPTDDLPTDIYSIDQYNEDSIYITQTKAYFFGNPTPIERKQPIQPTLNSSALKMKVVHNFRTLTVCLYKDMDLSIHDINCIDSESKPPKYRSDQKCMRTFEETIKDVFLFKTGISVTIFSTNVILVLSKYGEALRLINTDEISHALSDTFITFSMYNKISDDKTSSKIYMMNTKDAYELTFIEWKQLIQNYNQKKNYEEIFNIASNIYRGNNIKYFGVPEGARARTNEVREFVSPIMVEALTQYINEEIRLQNLRKNAPLIATNPQEQSRVSIEKERTKNIKKQVELFKTANTLEMKDFITMTAIELYERPSQQVYFYNEVFKEIFPYIAQYIDSADIITNYLQHFEDNQKVNDIRSSKIAKTKEIKSLLDSLISANPSLNVRQIIQNLDKLPQTEHKELSAEEVQKLDEIREQISILVKDYENKRQMESEKQKMSSTTSLSNLANNSQVIETVVTTSSTSSDEESNKENDQNNDTIGNKGEEQNNEQSNKENEQTNEQGNKENEQTNEQDNKEITETAEKQEKETENDSQPEEEFHEIDFKSMKMDVRSNFSSMHTAATLTMGQMMIQNNIQPADHTMDPVIRAVNSLESHLAELSAENPKYLMSVKRLVDMKSEEIDTFWEDYDPTDSERHNFTIVLSATPQELLNRTEFVINKLGQSLYEQARRFNMSTLLEHTWIHHYHDYISPPLYYYNLGKEYVFQRRLMDFQRDYDAAVVKSDPFDYTYENDNNLPNYKRELYKFVCKVFNNDIDVGSQDKRLIVAWLFTPTSPDREVCERLIPLLAQPESQFPRIMHQQIFTAFDDIELRDGTEITKYSMISFLLRTLIEIPYSFACYTLDNIAQDIADAYPRADLVQFPIAGASLILKWAFDRKTECSVSLKETIVMYLKKSSNIPELTINQSAPPTQFIEKCVAAGFTSIAREYYQDKSDKNSYIAMLNAYFCRCFVSSTSIYDMEDDVFAYIINEYKKDGTEHKRTLNEAIRDRQIFERLILVDSLRRKKNIRFLGNEAINDLFSLVKEIDHKPPKVKVWQRIDIEYVTALEKKDFNKEKPTFINYQFLRALSVQTDEELHLIFSKSTIQRAYFFCVCLYDKNEALPLLKKGVIMETDTSQRNGYLEICQREHVLDACIHICTLYSMLDKAIKAIKQELCYQLYTIVIRGEPIKLESIDRITACKKLLEPYNILMKSFDLLAKSPSRGNDQEDLWETLFNAFKLSLFKTQEERYSVNIKPIALFFSYFVVQAIARSSPSFVLEQLKTNFAFLNTNQNRLIYENVFRYLNYENLLSQSVSNMLMSDCRDLWLKISKLSASANTSFEKQSICATCHQPIKGTAGVGMRIFSCGHCYHDTPECCNQSFCPVCRGMQQNMLEKKSTGRKGTSRLGRRAKIRILDRAEYHLKRKYGKDADETTWGNYVYYHQELPVKKPKVVPFEVASIASTTEFNAFLEI